MRLLSLLLIISVQAVAELPKIYGDETDTRCKGPGCNMDPQTAMEKYKAMHEEGCGRNDAQQCDSLGALHMKANNRDEARTFFKKACELNPRYGCSNLGGIHIEAGDTAQALALFKKACAAGHDMGCSNLANLQREIARLKGSQR